MNAFNIIAYTTATLVRSAINSKVVEVTLATAASEIDLVATNVIVKDSDGNVVEVSDVAFAPWSTNGKVVLITLAADTTVGKFYSVTSGSKTVNFGGKAADTSKPTVTAVASSDYNEVTIDFSEAVIISGTVTLAQKYNSQNALEVSNISYVDRDTIKVTTADQSAATLYGASIKGFADLAGNIMADDTAKTFVGTAKDTSKFAGITATVVDSKTIEVDFNKKIDNTTTLDAANYTVKMKYAPYTEIAVASVAAKANTTDTVVLTLASDTTAATLYEVTAKAGVTTAYGVATTSDLKATFVGEGKDTTAIAGFTAAASSNTKVVLTMGSDAVKDAVDPATTADMFSIKLKYAPYTELPITGIKITNNTVTLTTGAQTASLYEVTMKAGVADKSGNATTADKTATFVGATVAAKITAITSIVRNSDTQITVRFNQNVGASLTDVSHYVIDGGIGYPEKAEATSNPNEVKLTIAKTVVGTLYTLTVKGLENADGVAMDAAGVTGKFAGQGISSTEPKVEAVVAIDAQTIKVYFDRSVSDATIKGASKLWNGTSLVAGAFLYNDAGSATQDLQAIAHYAYKDPSNANALIIRVNDTVAFKTSNLRTGETMFTLTVAASKVANDGGLPFAANDTAPVNPEIIAVVANDVNTLTVYFSEDVSGVDASDFIVATSSTSGSALAVNGIYAVDARTYRLSVANMTAGTKYYLRVVEAGNDADNTIDTIKDLTGIVELKATNGETAGAAADYTAVEFAGSDTAITNIKDIQVVMTDARTIVIYYPEAMNTTAGDGTDVTVATNYEIENAAGTDLINNATEIAEVVWNATNNTVTLTLNAAVDESTTGYYVKFAQTLENALGTKVVDNNGAVKAQFAVNTSAPAKVAIASAAYDSATRDLTITLNQKAISSNSSDPYVAADFVKDFIVTVKLDNGASYALVAADIASVTTTMDSDTFSKTIVVRLNATVNGGANTVAASEVGSVAFDNETTVDAGVVGLTGINGQAADTASTTVFIQ